jgi:cell division protein FtsQ
MKPEGVQQQVSRHPRTAGFVMLLLVVVTVGACLGANMWTRDFTVKEVRAEGNRIVSSSEILSLAAIPKNQKLFEVDLNQARKRVQANQFVRAVAVNRDVPDRISITVEERFPVAALATDKILYIDAEGVILPPARSEYIFDLPVITGALPLAECVPGKRVASDVLREALQIAITAQKVDDDFYRLISEIHIDPGASIELFTSESGVPVLFGRGDVAAKMVKLEAFWKEFVSQRGAGELKYIDLRFEDQVVVRWNQEMELASHQ